MNLRQELLATMKLATKTTFEPLKDKCQEAAQKGLVSPFVPHQKDRNLEDFLTSNELRFRFIPHCVFVRGGDPQHGNNFDDQAATPPGYEISWGGTTVGLGN